MKDINSPEVELRSRFQRILDEHVFQGIVGATMGVSVPGFEDMVFASGKADLEKDTAMRPDHLLRIASNTKTFVAAVILQLAQEQRLDLDQTIDRWLPDLPNAGFITVKQVLAHQSGIPDRNGHAEADVPPADSVWTLGELMDLAYSSHPVQAPGPYAYSNTNYIALAMIIEKETGTSWSTQVRERLLEPLGLKDTYTGSDKGYPQDRLSRGYAHDNGAPEDVTHRYPISLSGPAGDMISTAGDLLNWVKAAFGGQVIEEPYNNLFCTSQVSGTYPGTAMSGHSLGAMIHTYNDLEVVGYRGAIPGYISIMGYKSEPGIAVVILTNSFQMDRASYHVAGIDRPFESVFRTALAALR